MIEVWNCFALLLNDAFHLAGPSQIVTSVSFDMALISHAAIYSFFPSDQRYLVDTPHRVIRRRVAVAIDRPRQRSALDAFTKTP